METIPDETEVSTQEPQQDSDQPLSVLIIGETAGKAWQYLDANGQTSLIKLKSELSCTAGLMHLALGWLLREEKIELSRDRGHLFAKLK
jgi:hypothetical protein